MTSERTINLDMATEYTDCYFQPDGSGWKRSTKRYLGTGDSTVFPFTEEDVTTWLARALRQQREAERRVETLRDILRRILSGDTGVVTRRYYVRRIEIDADGNRDEMIMGHASTRKEARDLAQSFASGVKLQWGDEAAVEGAYEEECLAAAGSGEEIYFTITHEE